MAVTLVNDGDSEIVLQSDVSRWTQDAQGADKLEPTDDLVVAPPIVKLPPKGKQVVRLALLAPRDPERQMTYRLFVREVPEAMAAKDKSLQLPIALVLSMPVFITPASAKRQLACELSPSGSAQPISVVCTNTGNAYAQLREVEVRRSDKALARYEGSAYILPGSRRVLQLANEGGPATPGAAELRVLSDDPAPLTFPVSLP